MTTIERIHEEFDTAVETLEKISKKNLKKAAKELELATSDTDLKKDNYDADFLEKLGFSNVSSVKTIKEAIETKKKNKKEKKGHFEEIEKVQNIIKFYKQQFPFHKFILYSQVINICEKYNLYLGHASLYKGDIPKKNIEELKNFPYARYESNPFHKNYVPVLMMNEPVCTQYSSSIKYQGSAYSNDVKIGHISTYICAPYSEFETKDTDTIGKEIYLSKSSINPFKFKLPKKEPKDPIVLFPVIVNELQQIGFIVATKWGKEAEDENLIVPENN